MGNLLTSLLNSANTLQVVDRQLATIQNNVANAGTPGFARQTQTLQPMAFNLDYGLAGGVSAGPVLSSRSEYAEQSVRTESSRLGRANQQASDLAGLSSLFDLTGTFGISASLTAFSRSVSRLSINPNDPASRQSMLDAAQALAGDFRQTAAGIQTAGEQADKAVHDTVANINRLASQVADLNSVFRQSAANTSDAGLDARLHATFEELSQLADFTITRQADGTYNVYLAGQTPLVIGDHQFSISASASANATAVLDSSGADISGQIQSGSLAGALDERNHLIPSYTADLNTLAKTLADRVNQQLAGGLDLNGQTPAVDLFTYDSVHGEAATLDITAITPDQIAAATAGSPGGNGNALALSDLLGSNLFPGQTLTEYFGALGGKVGHDLSAAQSAKDSFGATLAQARSFREQLSGVSLDEEAANLLVAQRAYQASGKLMTVLNDLMDTLMQVMR